MASTNNPRKKIQQGVETQVLIESRRRCCLCFHLNGKLDANNKGQIAHIDRNRANNSEPNLAYLCLEHHDEYDSRTSQSKGITPDELRHAKSALLVHNRGEADPIEAVKLTLTIDGDRQTYTEEEQRSLLRQLLPTLEGAASASLGEVKEGQLRVTVSVSHGQAEKLCRQFNDNELSPAICGLALAVGSTPIVEFDGLFDPRKTGVSRQQVLESIRSADKTAFYTDDLEVPFIEAQDVGLFVKHFKSKKDGSYSVLVVGAFGSEHRLLVYDAFKLIHQEVRISTSMHAMECLRAFLDAFGCDFKIPGLGTSNLFFSKRTTVPDVLAGRSTAILDYWLHLNANPQGADCAVVSNIHASEVGPFAKVRLIIAYSRARYLRSIRHPNVTFGNRFSPIK